METIDLTRVDQESDSARFRQAIENMQFNFYRRVRELRPDRQPAEFVKLGLWNREEVERFEARFRQEVA